MKRNRCGTSLLELMVAMPLFALLTAVAVHLLLNVYRSATATDGVLGATRELRHGANVLASEWRGLRHSDLVAWTDTSIEFYSTVGVGVVCSSQSPGNTLAIIGASSTATEAASPLQPIWKQSIQPGDVAEVWLAPQAPLATPYAVASLIQSTSISAECSGASNNRIAALPTLRLTLADTLAAQPAMGTPVRVTRPVRYSLYRSSDGEWYLGRKARTPTGWDVVQPVAGPLQSAHDHGLTFQILDRNNSILHSSVSGAIQAAVRLQVVLFAPQRAGRSSPLGAGTDSLSLSVTLRVDSAGVL